MNLRLRTAVIAAALSIATGGCSWFHRGDDADGATRPIDDPKFTASPVKADRNSRTGDYRRSGVLDTNATLAGNPSLPGSPAVAASTPAFNPTPTSRPVSAPEYLVLGSIVANVNGTPIYAHELIRQVAPLLRARARELDEAQFKKLAFEELKRQRRTLIGDELEYAAAQRNTTQDEAREAESRTFIYRERLISQAGGSLQMARSIARDQGEDFDLLLKKEEHNQLVAIYYRKRVLPRVAITIDEMRRYYEQNREKLFTVPARATMRMIRIDLKDVGSESAALDRINEARRRAGAGEPFEALCAEYNRMPMLVESKGVLGPVSKGAYAVAAVDEAIWTTPVGEVSPVIRTKDALYLINVTERTEGRTMAFDEAEVQTAIDRSLRKSKLDELQARRIEALQKDAVIQADDALLQPCVEMAMQMYGEWRGGVMLRDK